MKKQFKEAPLLMIKLKYIIVFLVLISSSCFSQTTYNNLDSLLSENFQTVNNRDSVAYLSLINQSAVFTGKKAITRMDSLLILQPFKDAFQDMIDNLADMTSGSDFTVKYANYELINRNSKLPENGTIRLHVTLIVNNTFSIKMPMAIAVKNSIYSIESPMTVMFLEEK
ncbi:MAG: hypothetical protein V4677_07925 [Bacteroidota bacterium]